MTESTAPGISERYLTARNGSDIIGAVGMAANPDAEKKHRERWRDNGGGVALMLWNVMHAHRRDLLHRLSDALSGHLADHMLAKKMKGKPRLIARQVVAWWLHGMCHECHGTGWERIPDTPCNSDNVCPGCGGTRKVELKVANPDAAKWLIGEMERMSSNAESAIRWRLREAPHSPKSRPEAAHIPARQFVRSGSQCAPRPQAPQQVVSE